MKIATREIIREIDRLTIKKYGVPGLILMENAGRAVADVLLDNFDYADRVAIFAGGGNNGGDGFVVARHLISEGLDVNTYVVSDPKKYKGDALTNYKALVKIGGNIIELKDNLRKYKQADVIVDALFGTGLDREVTGFYKKVIEFINVQGVPTIAVDIPSGLDSNSGYPLGTAILADITVTFVLPKLGISIYPGVEFAGEIYVADITTPDFLEDDIPYELLSSESVVDIIEPRYEDTHKGIYGHLFILAGSPGKSGAAALSALGAQRSGTGLVTVGIPKSLNPIMEQKTIEAMTEPLPETDLETFGIVSLDRAMEIAENKKTAIAIGPGISTTNETREFLYEIIRNLELPMVIDADALTLIADNPKILNVAKAPIVLTPHPGEMSRLAGISTEEVQANRIGVALDFSTKYNVYLVLKGARSVISTPQGEIYINTTGNAGMASGGMGDVLTGIIGGLLAQQIEPADACTLGVFAHGLAGDLAAEQSGEAGIIASDVANKLPNAIRKIPKMDDNFITKIR
ncbi:MAG: bifunctional NAD(P)H-hydrate repair enzyme [Thermodesulfobacteriota bacterium]|nr:MAG: bifunctional NAD(P)H-hydrate repair enzyme [Thermodesulfobacteriota bacterium]